MNFRFFSTIILSLFSALSAHASAAAWQDARDSLKQAGTDSAQRKIALQKYSQLAKSSSSAALSAEYSLALAANGLTEAALWELDRAFLLDAADNEVLYVSSVLFAALGYRSVAEELARPAPDWIAGAKIVAPGSRVDSRVARSDVFAVESDFKEDLLAANGLLLQARYATAVDRLARLTSRNPKEPMSWGAYSLALEKLGAFKAAAQAAGQEIAMATDLDGDTRTLLTARQAELSTHEPIARFKPNEALQGTYTAYAGGGFSRGGGSTSYAFNAQAGKFVDDHVNVSLATGFSKSSKFSLGISGRYHEPLPGAVPMNLTAGAKVDYVSSPSTFGFLLSPGASYFIRESSLDATLDIGILGAQKGVITFSLGYTFYFRGMGS